MKTLLSAVTLTTVAMLTAGCATDNQPITSEAMGKAAPRPIECDMTATRIKPRECNQNLAKAGSLSKDDVLEMERRAQQVQVPLVPGGR